MFAAVSFALFCAATVSAQTSIIGTIRCGQTVTGYLPAGAYYLYQFNPAQSMVFHSCGATTSFDTYVEVIRGDFNSVVAGDDDHSGDCNAIYADSYSTASYLSWSYSGPSSYPTVETWWLRMRGFSTGSTGNYQLTMSCTGTSYPTPNPTNRPTMTPEPTPMPTPRPTAAYTLCDVGQPANAGGTVTCKKNTTLPEFAYGDNNDYSWPVSFRLTNSRNDNSWCSNPTLTFRYVQNDFVGSSKFLKVFESDKASPGNPVVATCGQDNGASDCSLTTCFSNVALTKNYQDADAVDVSIYVAPGVEGWTNNGGNPRCTGGYLIDANIELTCTRATTPQPTPAPIPTAQPTNDPTTSTTPQPTKRNRNEPASNGAGQVAPSLLALMAAVMSMYLY